MAGMPEIKIAQLDPVHQAMLLLRTPLLPRVRYTRARPRSLNDVLGWAVLSAGGLIVGLVSGLMWKSDIGDGNLTRGSSDAAGTELAFAVIGFVIGLGSVFGIVEDMRRLFEQWRGETNRYGLLLDEDVLILRVDRPSCTLLPRRQIIRAESVDISKTGTGARMGTIIFHGDDGKDSALRIPDALVDASHHDDIVKHINEWLADGNLAATPGQPGSYPGST